MTDFKIHGIITTKDEGKENPQKTRKGIAMKKATMETIRTALLDAGYESTDPIMVELEAELSKDKVRKEATAKEYAEMWGLVRKALTDATAPVTAQEIADETGLARGKIVYGLTHGWADEVVKDTSGKSTTYALKA